MKRGASWDLTARASAPYKLMSNWIGAIISGSLCSALILFRLLPHRLHIQRFEIYLGKLQWWEATLHN